MLLLGALLSGLVLDRWGPPRTMRACLALLAVGQAMLVAPMRDNAVWLWLGVTCLSLPMFGACCSALSARCVSVLRMDALIRASLVLVSRVCTAHSLVARCVQQFPSSITMGSSVRGPILRSA